MMVAVLEFAVTVDYATSDGTATSGTLTFDAGDTERDSRGPGARRLARRGRRRST